MVQLRFTVAMLKGTLESTQMWSMLYRGINAANFKIYHCGPNM